LASLLPYFEVYQMRKTDFKINVVNKFLETNGK